MKNADNARSGWPARTRSRSPVFHEEHTELCLPAKSGVTQQLRQCLGEQAGQAVSVGVQCGVDRVVGSSPQRCQPAATARLPDNVPAGTPGPGASATHLGAPAERGGGHPPLITLPKAARSAGGSIPYQPPTADLGTVITSSRMNGACSAVIALQRRVEAGPGRDATPCCRGWPR